MSGNTINDEAPATSRTRRSSRRWRLVGLAVIAIVTAAYFDSLGYRTLQLDPAYPLLFRHFPIVVFSTPMRFVRDSTGQWQEEDR